MKKVLSFVLTLAMILSLCCFGSAYAEEPKPAADKEATVESAPTSAEPEAAEKTAAPEDEPAASTEEAAEAESEPTVGEDKLADAEEDKEAETPEAAVEAAEEDVFADWNKTAPALNKLIEYMDAVTDESSPDFIPTEDRIAVFDMDGTLYGELFPTYLEYYMLAWRILKDPSISPDTEMLALGRELRQSVITHEFASDMPIRHAQQAARAYSGLTLAEFADFVNSILVRDVDGFEGMTYATAFYTPMLEVIDYLQDNDFTVYVCSGSDRAICRSLLEGMIDIPYANIIGMDVAYEATGQGDVDGLDYVFKASDDVVRTDKLIIKNLKMNKVLQIVQDIGQKPVLSFGNSSGDVSMHMYTISNNPYRSAAFMLIADDEVRDYGNKEKAEKLGKEWEADGFNVISMKNDFRTIYGDNVVKTDSFRWAEELAEDRTPVEDSPEWVNALAEEKNAEQLLVVAAVGDTTASVSLHQKDEKGNWKQLLTTPGYIGKNGLGKEAEGDGKTPVGTFSFNKAFGIAADPGCALEYKQVNREDYWSGDQRDGYHYNELVSLKDLPDLNTDDSEHIIDYFYQYQYCLNISYNEKGTEGLGSAIFLHCLGPDKPYTGGCVAIPQNQMLAVMKAVRPDCVVVIDSLENLSPETVEKWGLKSAEETETVGEAEVTDAVESTEAAEGVDAVVDLETAVPVEAPEGADAAAPADAAESVAAADPADPADASASENAGTADAPDVSDTALFNEAAEPAEAPKEAEALQIDLGSSKIFTEPEMDDAIAVVLKEFEKWEGCEMHSIRFAGDSSCSKENVRWLNKLTGGHKFTRCIEFLSDFHSPLEEGGAWNPDSEYTNWQWWLGGNEAGDWVLVTWGY